MNSFMPERQNHDSLLEPKLNFTDEPQFHTADQLAASLLFKTTEACELVWLVWMNYFAVFAVSQ